MLLRLGWKSGAAVSDDQLDSIPALGGTYDHPAFTLRCCRCFDGIQDQIDHYLLELDGVAEYGGHSIREREVNGHSPGLGLALKQLGGAATDVIDTNGRALSGFFAKQHADVIDQVYRARVRADDVA